MKNKIKLLLPSLSSLFNSQLLLHHLCCWFHGSNIAHSMSDPSLPLPNYIGSKLDLILIKTYNIRFGKKWQDLGGKVIQTTEYLLRDYDITEFRQKVVISENLNPSTALLPTLTFADSKKSCPTILGTGLATRQNGRGNSSKQFHFKKIYVFGSFLSHFLVPLSEAFSRRKPVKLFVYSCCKNTALLVLH